MLEGSYPSEPNGGSLGGTSFVDCSVDPSVDMDSVGRPG